MYLYYSVLWFLEYSFGRIRIVSFV